jgi:oligogalacturonide lyase
VVDFSRRDFIAMAAVGALSGPEWRRYSDPATEWQVLRLTDPASTAGMTAPHLHAFTRRSDSLLYWSEREGARQAFLLNLRSGTSRQLTDVPALDGTSLSLGVDERSFFFFDGAVLNECSLAKFHSEPVHRVPEGCMRTGFSMTSDGAAIFVEGDTAKSRIVSVFRQQVRPITEVEGQITGLMARPRQQQILYRLDGSLWLVNADGSAKRRLKTEPGHTGEALWTPTGHTFIYLHVPEDPKELITLREHSPDDGTDTLLAKTSQFISASPNGDASVFTGASRSVASAYVLILLRVTRRELTLCEHHASDPHMVQPVFTPDSRSVLFVSDRHGKPAIYLVSVAKFVEATGDPA